MLGTEQYGQLIPATPEFVYTTPPPPPPAFFDFCLSLTIDQHYRVSANSHLAASLNSHLTAPLVQRYSATMDRCG